MEKDNNVWVDPDMPFVNMCIEAFFWLFKMVTSWNEIAPAAGSPCIEAHLVYWPPASGSCRIELKIFCESDGAKPHRIILYHSFRLNDHEIGCKDCFFSAINTQSFSAMSKLLHSGVSNQILLTPISKN